MLYWSDWLQTKYTTLTYCLAEPTKNVPVKSDLMLMNWRIEAGKVPRRCMKNKLETIFFSCCTDQIGFKRDTHHSPVALWRWSKQFRFNLTKIGWFKGWNDFKGIAIFFVLLLLWCVMSCSSELCAVWNTIFHSKSQSQLRGTTSTSTRYLCTA